MHHMVFDVESVGLHGEGFAVGYVVVDEAGNEVEAERAAIDPRFAYGSLVDHEWVRTCVPPLQDVFGGDATALRRWFWNVFRRWSGKALLWADCGWPVKARFLAQCVDDQRAGREWNGPYPLHEIATAALLAGCDPIATDANERLPNELPAHDPLADARQSARLLIGYLKKVQP